MMTYHEFFHYAVLAGIASGLQHPVDWLVYVHRMPEENMTPEYYQEVERFLPRLLIDFFGSLNLRLPTNADEVLRMCDKHYPKGHLCRGYFTFLRQDIEKEIKRRR
ncbi:MAG: hypothetical protein J7J52_04830 [Deltaproteobacteria bacterium]|nr:hypothetical protein [Deltaproteobacteria bacterium]